MILYLDGEGICLELKPVDEQLESNRFDEKLLEDINYFTSLFRCSVDYLKIDGDYLSEDDIDFGFNKLKKLFITGKKEITNDKLTYLLEHFEVTETISINIPISNTFNCAPKLLKAKEIWFECGMSAGWVTGRFLSFLSHYDSVHQLMFNLPQFTIKDAVSVIVAWFRGRAPSLKSMIIRFKLPVQPRDLENKYFKPMPFDAERRPAVLVTTEGYSYDLSDALDIVRSDGELATIYIEDHDFWFHVWSEDERRRLPLK
ncbi:hypothetical protein CAEBREN_05027 [Caenorhabditis brenneri]|uniref:F-box associated domain-containing protein n=1 Tax=Caenorhabditis brenneri TaxID=135651 RepID=G0NHH8_CAEBE|nr:hypothetical protein CAEBREN_05027 [Caenorhabditis brenneri]